MKNFFLIFLSAFLFLAVSCATTDTTENDELRLENVDLRLENVELGLENDELVSGIEALKNENNELRNENDGLAAENEGLINENAELAAEAAERAAENDELRIENERRRAENDQLTHGNVQLTQDNEQLRNKIADIEAGINTLSGEMDRMINANSRLMNRVDELLADNERLRDSIAGLMNANVSARNENEQLRSMINQLENENNELRAGNDDLRNRFDEIRNWFNNAQAQPAAETSPVTLASEPAQVIQTVQAEVAAPEPAEQAAPYVPAQAATPEPQRPSYAPGPSTRLDSPAQMGMMPQDTEIFLSRIAHADAGQMLEIPFRGNGWVYLGELSSRPGISYNSRRNDTDGQTFVFSLDEAGTYVLKFYRQDFIRDFILNDHVQVIVSEARNSASDWVNPLLDRARITAQPRWPSALEEAQILNGTRQPSQPVVTGNAREAESAPPAQGQTSVSTPAQTAQSQTGTSMPAQSQTAPSVSATQNAAQLSSDPVPAQPDSAGLPQADPQTPAVSPNELLRRAGELLDAGNTAAAVPLLDQYLEYYPGGSDEALWLLGQIYEANNADRNILLSLGYYRRLTNEYPQSSRFEEARRRIAYLERFYINIQ